MEIPDEFKIKREQVFEFTQKPVITRKGDNVTIRFEVKGFSDCTVAIENTEGKITRHLASGVLGRNAPAPFQKNSKKQTVVWDGKDDQGRYLDNKEDMVIRVSLGLKPQFERTLFWSPYKQVGNNSPIIAASQEGVVVTEGCGIDYIRMFDHQGRYVRTIYPFPQDKLNDINGLKWAAFPQDGKKLPLKHGPKHKSTLLVSGGSMIPSPGKYGMAANAMAVQGNRIALASMFPLIRMSTDGSTGKLSLEGSVPSITVKGKGGKPTRVEPRSAAFSPDGRWLYLTGYTWSPGHPNPREWLHCVTRLEYKGNGKLELFAGSWKSSNARSADQAFKVPTSVTCDAQGRVYVADFMNNRIQVYTPDGKLHKSIPVKHPVHVSVHPKTGEIYVGSWMVANRFVTSNAYKIPAVLTRLGPLSNPAVKVSYPLPLNNYNPTTSWNRTGGLEYRMDVDFWAKQPTVWLVPGIIHQFGGWGVVSQKSDLRGTGLLLLSEKNGKLRVQADFNTNTAKAVARTSPPVVQRQRLYVDPSKGRLYIAEGDSGVMKSFRQLVEVDPDTGSVKLVNLPLTAEDLAIDLNGYFYFRDDYFIVRFIRETWREVPFDYGEDRVVGFDKAKGKMSSVSALVLPATGRMGWWHLGGMAVSPKGNIAVTCCNRAKKTDPRETGENIYAKRGKAGDAKSKYIPRMYPGRQIGWEIHIWNKHGQLLYEDAVPGMNVTNGIYMDKDDNLYIMADQNRVLNGKPYFLNHCSTLVKVKPKKAKVLTAGNRGVSVPLAQKSWPDRPRDFNTGWLQGAEWMYGGVGFSGWRSGASCICWNTRAALDFFGRTFAPEIDHFSVAVLDTNGNLILRVGQYGNVDDGVPLVKKGGPLNPRSIGGDEVALFHGAYVAAHTDKRLFIADAGNSRILSVKLGYQTEEKTELKNIPDTLKK